MTNTGKSANRYAKAKELLRQRWAWFINKEIRFGREPRPKAEPENAIDKASRRTAFATVMIAIFTAVLVYVGYLQYLEIRDSGIESSGQMNQMLRMYRAQIAQLSKQAGDTHYLAMQTEDLASHMKDQASQTTTIARQAIVQANAAKSAADTAKDALTRGSRAWVGPDGMLILTQPLQVQITPVANQNLITITNVDAEKLELRNFGRDPALDVSTMTVLVVTMPPDAMALDNQVASQQDEACKLADSRAATGPIRGIVVFPNATSEFENLFDISFKTVSSNGFDQSNAAGANGPLMVAGCISYRDTFQNLHHTKMCFISTEPKSKLVAGSKLRLCHGSQHAD